MFVITVRFSIKKEHSETFNARVRRQAADSRTAEKGCLRFDILSDPKDPTRIFLYEIYADEAAFEVHLTTPHFLSFKADTQDWVESAAVERWSGPWD